MFEDDTSPRRRWPRSQRFELTAEGVGAEQRYRSEVVASRSEGGRASFDAARAGWAEPLGVQPGDGLYLGILRDGPIDLQSIADAVEDCGESRKEAKAALERLFDAGLVVTTDQGSTDEA